MLPLLGTLAVVMDAEVEDPHHDDFVGADRAEALLTSPLGGLDATDVRSLTRAMRARDRSTPARDLVRRAVLDPSSLKGLDGEPARRALRLADLVARARAELAGGATVEEVLWTLWDGSDWGRRLRLATQTGGYGARLAHRDLDAICALFEQAARVEEQRGHTSVREFLDTLSRPGDPGRHPRRPRASAARPCGCSRPTGPRGSSGAWSSSPTCRRAPGPTCAARDSLLRGRPDRPRRAACRR